LTAGHRRWQTGDRDVVATVDMGLLISIDTDEKFAFDLNRGDHRDRLSPLCSTRLGFLRLLRGQGRYQFV
jgi:hypothetical protein